MSLYLCGSRDPRFHLGNRVRAAVAEDVRGETTQVGGTKRQEEEGKGGSDASERPEVHRGRASSIPAGHVALPIKGTTQGRTLGQSRDRAPQGRTAVTLILREPDVAGLVTMRDAVDSVERCFAQMTPTRFANTPRSRSIVNGAALSAMHASLHYLGRGGAKV